MARNRDMHGDKKKSEMEASNEMFDDLFKEAEKKENEPEELVEESTPKETQESNLESVLETLPKKDTDPKPSIVNKGGKLKIGVKSSKPKKINYTKLNGQGLYELQKRSKDNSDQLKLQRKTFNIRPDILAIIMEVLTKEDGSAIKGLQAKFINNALINELVEIGVLDPSSLDQIEEY